MGSCCLEIEGEAGEKLLEGSQVGVNFVRNACLGSPVLGLWHDGVRCSRLAVGKRLRQRQAGSRGGLGAVVGRSIRIRQAPVRR